MKAVLVLVLLGVVSFISASDAVWVRGATPQDQGKYQNKEFTCLDGSKTISISRINDDYCDCEGDGSDEPGTSACKKAKFYCPNKYYVSEIIYSSRVNDGICDCCDGSDEWNSKVTCTNTCREQGEHTRQVKAKAIEDYKTGLKLRQDYIQKATQKKAEEAEELKSLKAELENVKAQHKEKKDAYDAESSREMEARGTIDELSEHEDKPEPVVDDPSVDKWADSQPVDDDADPVIDPSASTPKEEEGKKEEVKEEEKKEEAPKRELTEEEKAKLEEANKYLEERTSKKQEVDDLNNKVNDLERKVKDKEAFLAIDFGPDSAYLPLYGEPIKFTTIEYTYELDPFKAVKQEWTSLGEWKKWLDGGKKMRYDDGASCWGVTYKRNCEVSVVCGNENKILDVNEPNKCEYAMTLTTPAACEPAQLAKLEAEYDALVNPVEERHTFDTKVII